MQQTLESPVIVEETVDQELNDSEKYAHWVDAEKAEKARITGGPVVAMCGKVWVPKGDPENHLICPKCQELFDKYGQESFNV